MGSVNNRSDWMPDYTLTCMPSSNLIFVVQCLLSLHNIGSHISVVQRRTGAVRRVAEEQELGDGFSRPSSRPPRPRSPCQQLRQGAWSLGAWPVGKVPRVPGGGSAVQEEERGRTQFQKERRGSRRVQGEI